MRLHTSLIVLLGCSLFGAACLCSNPPISPPLTPDAGLSDGGEDSGVPDAGDEPDAGAQQSGDAGSDGGSDAGVPQPCGAFSCAGCCSGSVCVNTVDQSNGFCGHSNDACNSCGALKRCEAGLCVRDDPNPCLVFSPDELDFGVVQPGCSVRRTVKLLNLCASSSFNSAKLLDGGVFTLSNAPDAGSPTYPIPELVFEFAPTIEGSFEAQASISVNVAGQPAAYPYAIRGIGSAGGRNADEFTVRDRADVLLVLDTSGGTQAEVDFLRDRGGAFLEWPKANGVSFHLSSVASAQSTFGGPPGGRVMNAMSPLADFTKIVPDGGTGSAVEDMNRPIFRGLTPPQSTGPNAGFVRRDALLGVLLLTDIAAPDESVVDLLRSIKGHRNENDVIVSSIARVTPSIPASCHFNGLPENASFAQFASATSGVAFEVCDLDMQMIKNVSKNLFGGEQHTFRLRAASDGGTPDVFLNGSAIPSTSGSQTVWTIANDVLSFEQNYFPSPGDVIRVEYPAACGP